MENLTTMDFGFCSSSSSSIEPTVDSVANLKLLSVSECNNLQSMPQQMQRLTSLRTLTIAECAALASFPDGGLPVNLELLSVSKCNRLQSMPEQMQSLTSLKILTISECAALLSFPDGGGCSGVESFPDEGLLPAALTVVHISGFRDLKSLNLKGFRNLNFLKTLNICDCNNLNCMSDGQLPLSLDLLNIIGSPLLKERKLLAAAEQLPTSRFQFLESVGIDVVVFIPSQENLGILHKSAGSTNYGNNSCEFESKWKSLSRKMPRKGKSDDTVKQSVDGSHALLQHRQTALGEKGNDRPIISFTSSEKDWNSRHHNMQDLKRTDVLDTLNMDFRFLNSNSEMQTFGGKQPSGNDTIPPQFDISALSTLEIKCVEMKRVDNIAASFKEFVVNDIGEPIKEKSFEASFIIKRTSIGLNIARESMCKKTDSDIVARKDLQDSNHSISIPKDNFT
ncbi:hypothetical protein GH714_004125 [Hevea brasiliensis]|uniref:Uncharacterized protein n=1 Tax=Hevea brasiliensis TaxID=3981 RepID=A0A6A6KXE6_HEVBR|nr:hypothetical protein GH714_004125 [Hevea brasiliensis]